MTINPDFVGRSIGPSAPYRVEAAALRAFATAVGATNPACFEKAAAQALGHGDIVAAPTFAVVIAQAAEAAYIADPAAGIDFDRVVHAEEHFIHHRPIQAGDLLTTQIHVEAITQRGPLALVTTRAEITDAAGPVTTVTSTLAVRQAG